MCCFDLLGFVAGHALGFGQVAAQVPDPLAVGRRMGGDRYPRLGSATQAVGVQRFQRRALGQHHMQWAQLLGGLTDAELLEQFGIAAAGAEDDALCADLTAIDAQANQCLLFTQRLNLLGGQQAVAGQFSQARDQARHVEDQFGQAVDLALEFGVLQRRRQLLALDLVDPTAHGLAGEEAGEVAGEGARRPQVVGLGQHAYAAQVQLAAAAEGFAPTSGHVSNRFRGAGQGAVQGVLGAAVDDALRFHALPAAEAGILHQQAGVAELAQARMQPETGDTAADDQHVRGKGLGHSA